MCKSCFFELCRDEGPAKLDRGRTLFSWFFPIRVRFPLGCRPRGNYFRDSCKLYFCTSCARAKRRAVGAGGPPPLAWRIGWELPLCSALMSCLVSLSSSLSPRTSSSSSLTSRKVSWRLLPPELDHSFSIMARNQDILPGAVWHPHLHGLFPAFVVSQLVEEITLC